VTREYLFLIYIKVTWNYNIWSVCFWIPAANWALFVIYKIGWQFLVEDPGIAQ